MIKKIAQKDFMLESETFHVHATAVAIVRDLILKHCAQNAWIVDRKSDVVVICICWRWNRMNAGHLNYTLFLIVVPLEYPVLFTQWSN